MAGTTRREWGPTERAAYAARCAAVEEAFQTSARREGKRYRVHCPECTSSKTGRPDHSLSLDAATGGFWCFRCGCSGKLREPPNPELAALDVADGPVTIEPPEGYVALGYEPGLSALSLEDARAYALKRHITPKVARELKVGAVLEGYYSGRLILPVLAADQETWLGWVGRDWTGRAEKPYLYPPGMPRGEFLFNHDALALETDAPALIVEGWMDAVPFWPDGCALLGKASNHHKEALLCARRPLVICLDGDAWQEGWALTMWLRFQGRRAGFIKMPPKVDPDECIEEVREAMIPSLDEAL